MTKRILIVDAEIGFTLPLKRALEETGEYEVRSVTRLMPAVTALQENRYDVAVLDTRLEQVSTQELMSALRQVQPDLPVILTSFYAEDEVYLEQLQAQWFLQKRYVARTLIPLLEAAITQGYSPFTAETRVSSSVSNEPADLIEPLLEISRTHPDMQHEPPITLYDSTIAEVIDQALNREVSQRIQAYSEADEPTQVLQREALASTPAEQADSLQSTVATVLAAAEIDQPADYIENSQPLPSLNQLLAMLPPPDKLSELARIEPPPTDEDTRYSAIPRPPRLPDQDWLDQFAPPPTLPEVEALPPEPDEESFFTASVEEITQQLMAVEQESIDEVMETAAAESLTPRRALAHYSVQLTQFSLESSAQGTLITRANHVLAKSGSFDDNAWTQIIQQINEAWSRPGDARTRVIYRRLPVGELLLYSILTVDDQTLTLIFGADTPLKLIRRQAIRLAESLQAIPDTTQPIQPIAPEAESRLPQGEPVAPVPEPAPPVRESTPPPPIEAAAPPQETAAPVALPVKPVDRGGYTHYACVWLLEDDSTPLSRGLIISLGDWLKDICEAEQWDFEHVVIEPDWIWIKLHVPAETLPNDIAQRLMEKSARLVHQVEPERGNAPLWSDGYLVVTPAQQLDQTTLDRFIRFYRREKLRS